MERGAKTRGKVAFEVAGAEAIEIKATVAEHQIDGALARFKLSADNDEERFIYFFDTPALTLLDAGIIVRARRVVGDQHDSTVKFRPVIPAEVAKKWRKFRDFKIEADASETGFVKSASFSMPVEKGAIKRVANGGTPIAAVLAREQQKFIASMAGRAVDFAALSVLGPLRAQRWSLDDPACPWPITVELWKREDGERLLEASIRAPAKQAAAARGGFMAFLAEVGADHDKSEQTKTRWALGYYAAKLAPAPAPKAAAKAVRAGRATLPALDPLASGRFNRFKPAPYPARTSSAALVPANPRQMTSATLLRGT